MQAKIVQVPPQPWPSGYGEIIAMIPMAPESLVDRYALELFEGSDNLGYYDAAVIQLPSGRRMGLAHRRGVPEPGVEVHADVQDDTSDAVHELLEVLGLPHSAVSWMRDALVVQTGAAQAH
ncbi:MAG TPA: hypothetical protein VLK84_23475 [Longimicrobium sp.]|nr:hypothetical protein [Longimicrobium sp.]